jgi:hypothetical protein
VLLPPFCVMRNGEPIAAVPLRNQVPHGIETWDIREELGMISEFEEREAAVFVGSPWMEWEHIDPRERAASVAHYRMHNAVSAHAHDAVIQHDELRRKREELRNRTAN